VAEETPARPSRPLAYHLPVQATLRDTDGLGHVNNGVYVSWLEEVRTRYVYDRRGLTDIAQVDFILASIKIDYRSPVLLHEIVDLWCAPSRIGKSSWDLVYEGLARGDGRTVFEAATVQVHFDYAVRKPAPIPDDWKSLLRADLIPAGKA